MNIAIPRWLAPWLVGVGLVSTAVALIVTIRAYAQLRRGEYYVIREEARSTALRASLVAFLLLILTVIALFFPRQERTSQLTPTSTSSGIPTATLAQVALTTMPTATATFTPQPTATEPFIPTSTPQATLPITFTTPFPSAVLPPADAQFEFWTLAQGVDENSQPINPFTDSTSETERVYLFFRYDGLLPNVPWTSVWYWNDQLLTGGSGLWETEQSAGEWHVFLEFPGGYPVGQYEVQVWLGDRLQIRAAFSVVNAQG